MVDLDDPETVYEKIQEIYCHIREDICREFEDADISFEHVPNCEKCQYLINARKRAVEYEKQQDRVSLARMAFEKAQKKLQKEEDKLRKM